MPGPPRTPTQLDKLRGNPSKKKLNEAEPEPATGALAPPGDFEGEALAEWNRVVPELLRLGLATVVDRAYLIAYCSAWASFEEARLAMAERGPLVEGRDGNLVKNPAAQIMRDSADMMIKFGSRFGLSPSDRTRLSVAPKEREGPDAQVLSLLS
jgi:P27 family predicted phage terminase small subunit